MKLLSTPGSPIKFFGRFYPYKRFAPAYLPKYFSGMTNSVFWKIEALEFVYPHSRTRNLDISI